MARFGVFTLNCCHYNFISIRRKQCNAHLSCSELAWKSWAHPPSAHLKFQYPARTILSFVSCLWSRWNRNVFRINFILYKEWAKCRIYNESSSISILGGLWISLVYKVSDRVQYTSYFIIIFLTFSSSFKLTSLLKCSNLSILNIVIR